MRARCCGIAISARSFSSVGSVHDRRPALEHVEHEAGVEREAGLHVDRHRQPDHLAAASCGLVADLELGEARVEVARPAGWITFQLSGRCAAADIVIISSATSSSNGPIPVAPCGSNSSDVPSYSPHTLASSMNSASLGEARRHRVAVARRCACRTSWSRSRSPPASQPVAQQAEHLRELVVGRRPLVGGLAHHDTPDRRVPDHEPGVDARGGRRGRRGTRRSCASSTARRRAATAAACPRPWPASA